MGWTKPSEMGDTKQAWNAATGSPSEGSDKRGLCGRTTEHLSTCLPGINPHNTIHHIQTRPLSSFLHDCRKLGSTEEDLPQAEPQKELFSLRKPEDRDKHLKDFIWAGDQVTDSFIQALGSAAKGNGWSQTILSFHPAC